MTDLDGERVWSEVDHYPTMELPRNGNSIVIGGTLASPLTVTPNRHNELLLAVFRRLLESYGIVRCADGELNIDNGAFVLLVSDDEQAAIQAEQL